MYFTFSFSDLVFIFHLFIWFFLFLPIQILDKKLPRTFDTNSDANISKIPGATKDRTISETEFVSDTFQTNDKDLEEVKAGMKKLGIDTLAQQAGKDGKNDFV